MLAYVFWHWKQPQVSVADYETRQRDFHRALRSAPPDGFTQSFSGAISQAIWAANGGDAYEDWYLINDFTALGQLNEGAISASRAVPHDQAAAVVAGGTAGVYGLRLGSVVSKPSYTYWFGKPDGITYRDLDQQLASLVEQYNAALWMRQMTLGPAKEFSLHATSPMTFPAAFTVQAVPFHAIWPD